MSAFWAALFALIWPPVAWADDAITPETEKTKLAARALYAEASCPGLQSDLSAIALNGAPRMSAEDWRAGGRLHGRLEAELKKLVAENGSTHSEIFCLVMETTLRDALKRR
jgi:hypothetical protein